MPRRRPAATLDHPTQQHCLLITLPARRLSFTPGVSPGPLFTPTLRSPALPSADDQMSLLREADAWGKGVVRNALASGLPHAPQTWTLAARSAADARMAARDQRAQRRAAVVGAALAAAAEDERCG